MSSCVLSSSVERIRVLDIKTEADIPTLCSAQIIESLIDTTHKSRFQATEVLKNRFSQPFEVCRSTGEP